MSDQSAFSSSSSAFHHPEAGSSTPKNLNIAATKKISTSPSSFENEDESTNDLTVLSCAGLLVADCMGTGILALPNDIRVVLGDFWGVLFLLINLPINLYAGYILSESARHVEDNYGCLGQQNTATSNIDEDGDWDVGVDDEFFVEDDDGRQSKSVTGKSRGKNDRQTAVVHYETCSTTNETSPATVTTIDYDNQEDNNELSSPGEITSAGMKSTQPPSESTFDFIGLTDALFGKRSWSHRIVISIYYTNIFLVLGNYLLVMSRSVRSTFGSNYSICMPQAGIIASVLMFGFSQLRTMAKLGKSATVISLLSLFIVVVMCVYHASWVITPDDDEVLQEEHSIFRKMEATASIGFAVGSQKLFLNIRHEMADRSKAPVSLAIALTVFGASYIAVCQLSGPSPPKFLLDAIPWGSASRQIAGLLLWIHVAVSFAINSQALCSSIDRLVFHRISEKICSCCKLDARPSVRWGLLTLLVATSSYLVANAVPFFQDLVALTGALTSIPLTLLLPAILYRRMRGVDSIWRPSIGRGSFGKIGQHQQGHWGSYALLLFSMVFMVLGLIGAISSIDIDWSNHGPPFSCD